MVGLSFRFFSGWLGDDVNYNKGHLYLVCLLLLVSVSAVEHWITVMCASMTSDHLSFCFKIVVPLERYG